LQIVFIAHGAKNLLLFQIAINKKFTGVPRLGIFSVTNLVGKWDNNNAVDYVTHDTIPFKLVKDFN